MDGEGNSQNQNQTTPNTTPNEVAPTVSDMPVEAPKTKAAWPAYAVGALVLIILLVGGLFLMEQRGVINTGLFGSADTQTGEIAANETVATVNGVEIKGEELTTSMNQIAATARLQGVDVTDPSVQADIRSQAVEMLVNTELLKQEAMEREVDVTDADVDARIDALVEEVGGEDALAERMATLGIDEETLRRDVRTELMIQALLDDVFAEANIEVTEEEVAAVYESAGGEEGGLPALEEVREQVEAQVRAGEEQTVIDEFLAELRADAEVEVE